MSLSLDNETHNATVRHCISAPPWLSEPGEALWYEVTFVPDRVGGVLEGLATDLARSLRHQIDIQLLQHAETIPGGSGFH
jgi:hypothetical protein